MVTLCAWCPERVSELMSSVILDGWLLLSLVILASIPEG